MGERGCCEKQGGWLRVGMAGRPGQGGGAAQFFPHVFNRSLAQAVSTRWDFTMET